MTKEQERTFDGQEKNTGDGVDTDLDADERGDGRHLNALGRAQLPDEMDDKLLNKVGTVGNAGDESDAGNSGAMEGQAQAERADKQRRHGKSDEGELPHGHCHGDVFSFAEIKSVSY